jgi:hypothetical protein
MANPIHASSPVSPDRRTAKQDLAFAIVPMLCGPCMSIIQWYSQGAIDHDYFGRRFSGHQPESELVLHGV